MYRYRPTRWAAVYFEYFEYPCTPGTGSSVIYTHTGDGKTTERNGSTRWNFLVLSERIHEKHWVHLDCPTLNLSIPNTIVENQSTIDLVSLTQPRPNDWTVLKYRFDHRCCNPQPWLTPVSLIHGCIEVLPTNERTKLLLPHHGCLNIPVRSIWSHLL